MNTYHNGLTLRDWLTLSFMPKVGPNRLASLWTYLNTWISEATDSDDLNRVIAFQKALQSVDYHVLRTIGWSEHSARAAMLYLQQGQLPYEAKERIEITERWLEQPDHQVVFRDSDDYPQLLQSIAVPPTFIYTQGNIQSWSKPCIGMVGARNASGYGKRIAEQWGQELSERGFHVCSGGAKGIDACAHQGALHAQAETTVVMGTGLLNPYPRQNQKLFERILEKSGVLISEYPLTTSARPQLFPPRNRIISGMSYGVVVVEASEKSGSLISARYALEENRDVFAVPGRIGDPQAKGTNHLIRQGATLVQSVDDIMLELPREMRECAPTTTLTQPNVLEATSLSVGAASLLDILTVERIGFDFDALIRRSGMGAADLSQTLMELELSGMVVNVQGQYQFAP